MEASFRDSIISRVDIWKGKEVKHEILSGGITNPLFKCTVDGKGYVLRIPGEGTDMFIDRKNERSATTAAANCGVAPKILSTVMPEDAVVIPFIEGEVMHPQTIAENDQHITAITEIMKKVHTEAVFDRETYVFDMIRKYAQWVKDVDGFFPHDYDWMQNISDRIEKAMDRNKPALAPCHNDVLSENFIFDGDGKMWLLDWEYGGMNDPYFDLGDFAIEHPFSREQEELIIKVYCGDLQEDKLYRLLLHKLTADLWWSLWAMIQVKISKLDFDFYQYGIDRYARFRMNYYDRDFETWINGV
jgi:thiamine kinase-like enzyme